MTSYHNSSQQLTVTRCNDLPQLVTTSYHNSFSSSPSFSYSIILQLLTEQSRYARSFYEGGHYIHSSFFLQTSKITQNRNILDCKSKHRLDSSSDCRGDVYLYSTLAYLRDLPLHIPAKHWRERALPQVHANRCGNQSKICN